CECGRRRGGLLCPSCTLSVTLQHRTVHGNDEDVPCACALVIQALEAAFRGSGAGTLPHRICGTSMKRAPIRWFSMDDTKVPTICANVTKPRRRAPSRADGMRSHNQYMGKSAYGQRCPGPRTYQGRTTVTFIPLASSACSHSARTAM